MFLKTLTLKGFKSFAESTTLDFEPGITVVVGPNGSGKSNIVDAVAWVLGAQGAKSMRSNKMEDVIFAGTAKKSALGRAEVSLTIDNASRTLPVDFAEVTITRTLFRTGESEYQINRVPCRLLDVQELLSDSGVGRQQHVIVSQGQLASILDSRPEDRRAVIEEAAGILKFRKRRERAQRRLEATEANFVRLADLLREIRRQLRPLERQANDAMRHGALTTELRGLRLHISGRELAALRTRNETQGRVRADLARKEQELREALARFDADVMLAESELGALGGLGTAAAASNDPWAGHDLGDVLARAEAVYQKARGQLAFLGERRRLIERDRNAFLDQGVVETLSSEASKIAAELERVDVDAERLPPEFNDLIRQESELADERERFLREWGVDTAAADGAGVPTRTAAQVRSERNAAQQSLLRSKSDRDRLDLRVRQGTEKQARLAGELARSEADVTELAPLVESAGSGASAAGAAIDAPPASVAEAAQRRTETEAAEAVAETELRGAEERRRAADGEQRAWAARVDALTTALDQARARAGAQRLAGLDGIVGTLLDLVEVDAGWEAAFEAAIGEAISSVVVRDAGVARSALARLHESGVSGAVLALGAAPAVAAVSAGVGEPVRAHVRSHDAAVSSALDALLASAVAVDGDWTAALDAAIAVPGAVVVTRTGDRFSASGWRAGTGSAGATGAALDEAREQLDAAKLVAATAIAEHQAATAKRDAARTANREAAQLVAKETAEHQRAVAKATADHERTVGRLASARAAVARLTRELADVDTEAASIQAQLVELAAAVAADEARTAELDAELPVLVEAEDAAAQRQARRREASHRLDQRAAAAGALRRDLEVRAAGLEERRRILKSRADEIDVRLSRSVTERAQAELRRAQLDLAVERVELLHQIVEDRAEWLEHGLADIRDRRRKQNEAARAATYRLDTLRKGRGDAETQLRAMRERMQRSEIEEAELRLRLETLVEQVRREFDVEPETAIAAECPPLDNATAPTTRVRDLERELRLMGPINPLALEEFTSIQERHQLIESELEDVKTARRDLVKVIKAIDEEIVTVFGAAFADVERNFTYLFELLFPGGSGSIRLTAPDDPLNTGVEVEARPSGKNVRKLSLLSGGERSLTALAFLFAVFRSRPSPFYLMDEVEAALDDVNLDRFLGLLHEFRHEAQLLVVSHQKRTMEAADCLYGVTMQPGGSSKVLSERVRVKNADGTVVTVDAPKDSVLAELDSFVLDDLEELPSFAPGS